MSSSTSADLSRQYISSLSILAVSLFVGVPIWWKTTEVYRCSLPYKEIGNLDHVPPELSFRISVALLSDSSEGDSDVDTLVSQLNKELVVGSIAARRTRIALHYLVESHKLSSQERSALVSYLQSDDIEDFSSHVADVLPSSLGHYSIILVPDSVLVEASSSGPSQQQWRELSVFVSRYRHTIIRVKDKDLSGSLADLLKVIRSVYGDKKYLEKSLKNAVSINQDRDNRADVDSMRQLRATQGYQVSFTLLTPDPSQVQATWNIEEATSSILMPFLEHPGIASLGNFTVSSQEFYYTDMKFKPRKSQNSYHILPSHLPPMISSVESKLASHVSQFPSLNFLVYVPKSSESPLYIQSSDSVGGVSLTDNFLVPQWGGMVIYNPAEPSGEGGGSGRGGVSMEELMPVFIEQLKMLLGVPDLAMPVFDDRVGGAGERFQHSTGKHDIVDWRVDQLLIGKLVESTSMATTSLVSLVQLLDKVKNMVISDHIQKEVESALFSIQECYKFASSGQLKDAYDSAKQAMQSAEIAFFDPSILELLYFPDDQKFAIYIPLFLPISVPILFSSMAAFKWLVAWLKGAEQDTDSKPQQAASEPSAETSEEAKPVDSTESGDTMLAESAVAADKGEEGAPET